MCFGSRQTPLPQHALAPPPSAAAAATTDHRAAVVLSRVDVVVTNADGFLTSMDTFEGVEAQRCLGTVEASLDVSRMAAHLPSVGSVSVSIAHGGGAATAFSTAYSLGPHAQCELLELNYYPLFRAVGEAFGFSFYLQGRATEDGTCSYVPDRLSLFLPSDSLHSTRPLKANTRSFFVNRL